MKIFGSINIPNKIEFISYSPQYHDQVLDVIRKSFFQYETVSVGSEINTNAEAQKDLEILCDDVLTKSGVSVIARDVEGDKIVGVSLNVIQVNEPSSDTPTYFEMIRDEKCKTQNAKCLMNYMITADSKVNLFEHFKVDCLFEIMFLAVLQDYGRRGIGLNLCKYSVDIARTLKDGKDVEDYLTNGEPLPQLISSLFTGRNTQVIGKKLDFVVIYQEPFSNYFFNGKSFAERVDDPSLVYHVAAKKL